MKKILLLSALNLCFAFNAFSQCNNGEPFPPGIHTKNADYYCHQYVKAALIGNFVNMTTGVPNPGVDESQFITLYQNANTATDPAFIRVCNMSDAKAVVPLHYGSNTYHSALILTDGLIASTPSATSDYIWKYANPKTFTSACAGEEEYYAVTPNVSISGPTAVNQNTTVTYTLNTNGQLPSFITLNANHWTFNSTYFTEVANTRTSTSITLTSTSTSGPSTVGYYLSTGCNGTNNLRSVSVSVFPNCTGTLNGGPLYTFNSVSSSSNAIVMVLNSWTWVRTSGSASWTTSNGGKNMNFNISSGCSTFNAYNSSCNITLTFCKSSYFVSYSLRDMYTMKVIKEGKTEESKLMDELVDSLPAGYYILNVNGKSQRFIKSD